MKLKELIIIGIFIALLIFTFLALTTTVFLPETTIPIVDGIVIIILFSGFVTGLMYINLIETKKMKYKVELRNSQLETILNSVDTTLLLSDLDGTILAVNHGNADLLGYTVEELIGKNISDVVKNSEEIIKKAENKVIAKKQISKFIMFVESNKNIAKYLKIGMFPFLDDKGNVDKIIVCYTDNTFEQKVEKTKNDFIETLTHDLKTPTITQIKALEMLKEGFFGSLSEVQKEIIGQIKNSCEYMNELIFTILDTFVIENGEIKLKQTRFNMVNLVKDITKELNLLASGKNKTFKIEIDEDVTFIYADKLQLKRVIFNLISNAVKYGENNSVIDIIVEKNADGMVDFRVVNKSDFLNSGDLQNIFDKYKSKANSKISKISTGLGLYLSKRIVEKHDGQIYAKCSDEDKTCTFGFVIPKKEF